MDALWKLPNALVQLQAQYHHWREAASERCLSAATFVRRLVAIIPRYRFYGSPLARPRRLVRDTEGGDFSSGEYTPVEPGREMVRMTVIFFWGLIGLCPFASTASAGPQGLPGQVIDVVADSFFFRAPATVRAGLTTFRLHSPHGGHEMQVIRRTAAIA